jgi:hypothetical protein
MTRHRQTYERSPILAGSRTRPPFDWMPTFQDLSDTPELAILSVLVGVLDVLQLSLAVANPGLFDNDRPYWLPTPRGDAEALTVLRRADQLRCAVHCYRKALIPPPSSPVAEDASCEIPF